MSQTQERRLSIESSHSSNKEVFEEKISITKEEESRARASLYKILFKEWMAVAAIFPCILQGIAPILIYLVIGKFITAMSDFTMSRDDKIDKLVTWTIYLAVIAVVAAISKYISQVLWIRVGSKMSVQIKKDLFDNMMKSEIEFFDTNPIGGILTLLSEDAALVQDAFGTVKENQIANIVQFLGGIVCAFIYSWQMALIAFAVFPVMGISAGTFLPAAGKKSAKKFEHTSAAITIAEETLAAIRTVKSFNREETETARFDSQLISAQKLDKCFGSLLSGMMFIIMIGLWGMVIGNLYFGGVLVKDGKLEIGDIFSVFAFIMFGSIGMLMIAGTVTQESKAIAAGARIVKLSQHTPKVQYEGGQTIPDFQGEIEFRNVSFKYPARDVYVLKNVSFKVNASQFAALVGHSGSGKSTCVQLIERYYDVTEGVILVDGVDISTVDPRWLHRQIGLVSQEPSLFQMTIRDNIKYGNKTASEEEVLMAAEVANAKKFIEKMAHGLDELVAEKGSSLSGGQRQRIAIARAVIKNPRILVTDEATSALDAESEKKVQLALDRVMVGRTAIVVAHRLSTIRNANIIYVFDDGEIKEVGTHDELVQMKGFYYNLVKRQLTDVDRNC